MKRKLLCCVVTLMFGLAAIQAKQVVNFSFDIKGGQIYELVSNNRFAVKGNFAPENIDGAAGKALRFDGYTTGVDARVNNVLSDSPKTTFSVWVAAETYPIVEIDNRTTEKVAIADCLNSETRSGFAFLLGMDGKVEFRSYVGGWDFSITPETLLPTGKWVNLTVTLDKDNRQAIFYMNGEIVGQSRCNGTVSVLSGNLYIGHCGTDRYSGPFRLTSFSGMIDDLTVWDEVKDADEIKSWKAENQADFSVPQSRFADDLLRPAFHGMPSANWSNETHGLTYCAGRYHLFFQKNANGPYMARLHWGHLSSHNLVDWQEEPIAIAPGADYDFKGCWSGCVFSDDEITGGLPAALYTGVDYARAVIAMATPVSDNLIEWAKEPAPVINGRPAGLSDDFRDPYFFRNGNDAYIIVGSSKNGIGTTTLHKYNSSTGSWSNTGELFFSGSNAATDGTFWEMPNITKMPNGKWLFTATPLGTSQGVRTLYWTGEIAADGTFQPDAKSSTPRLVEMNSRHGFGLLSPTVYRSGDRTIVLGIVPDKLPSETNWKLGWAHCYSLPREWALTDEGSLIQKPAAELTELRTATAYSNTDFNLNGSIDLAPVSGRSAEICATFVVGTSEFGFNIFKSGASEAKVYYNPVSGEIIADFTGLNRISNDSGTYDGIYRCPLPVRPKAGETLKMNIFIDHSILDIFINDKWATSIRVFPTDENADGIEVFSTSPAKALDLKAWKLDVNAGNSAIDDIRCDKNGDDDRLVDIYNLQGVKIRSKLPQKSATENLPSGWYIVGNKTVLVR